MNERISGMQDINLRYPAPDPLSGVPRDNHAEVGSTESSLRTPEALAGLGGVVLETGEFLISTPRRQLQSYEQQIEQLAERRQFMAY